MEMEAPSFLTLEPSNGFDMAGNEEQLCRSDKLIGVGSGAISINARAQVSPEAMLCKMI